MLQHLIRILLVCTALGNANAMIAQSPSQTGVSEASKDASLALVLARHGYTALPLEEGRLLPGLRVVFDTVDVVLEFDSGFSGNMEMKRSRADALGIRGARDRSARGAGGDAAADSTHVGHVTVGTTQLGPQFIRVVPDFPVYEGAVGASFARAYNVVFSYPDHAVYFQGPPGHGFTLLPGFLEKQGYVAIPLTCVAKGKPEKTTCIVHAFLGSTAVVLVLDTGASEELYIDQRRADEVGLRATSTRVSAAVGGRGSVTLQGGKAGPLTLGGMRLDSLSFQSMDLTRVQQRYQEDSLPHFDGILGAGVLNAHHAIIDFYHGLLYLRDE